MTTNHFNIKEARNFEAIIDDKTVRQLEVSASSNARGQQRRLVLVALSRDSATLANASTEAPDAYKEMIQLSEMYLEHAKALVEMAEQALLRLKLADNKE